MNEEKLFYTTGEVAEGLHLEQHVLRFWEGKFYQIKPIRSKGRRLYNRECIETIKQIKYMLYDKRYTIQGVQKELNGYTKTNHDEEYLKNLLQEMTDLRDYVVGKIVNEENNETLQY
ncbi:MAG: MerR family transcriptional regulator [Wolbachia sp.]|nr:MerR family transcriptional regulator [Wolbachia sp.]MDD9336641.1 MerR family transcriptional regulator [Wolbachia sp.]